MGMIIEMIVIGVSAGASNALPAVLAPLPFDFDIPIVIVRHQLFNADDTIIRFLDGRCHLHVTYARENDSPKGGRIYLVPPDRHLYFASSGAFKLRKTPKVNYCRPSADVLFASAAAVFGPRLAGVVLTGANTDGAQGLKTIKENGGLAIVQNPKSAEAEVMPNAAINTAPVDYIIWLNQIGPFLWDIQQKSCTT